MFSRRDVLIGAGLAIASTRARAASTFDVGRFIEDCRNASHGPADAQSAVQDVLARAMSNPGNVLAGVGEPQKGGIKTLHRSTDLTILNIVWSPLMQLMPHEHNMWSVIGIYTGREDNIFWQRHERRVSAMKATAISQGSVVALPRDVIHSVANPIEKLTGAIHIYGGDFFATPRSEWDPETLTEREWSIQNAVRLFEDSNNRFFNTRTRGDCK